MKKIYSSLITLSAFKKSAQYSALTILLISVAYGSAKAQTPAITYPLAKTFAAGMPISAFGPTTSSNVSALSYSFSTVVTDAINPNGVAVDAAGNIFYTSSQEVYFQPAGGSPSVIASGFAYIGCLAIDADGNLFVGDVNNQNIIKIANPSQPGRVRTTFVTSTALPEAIAFDKQNHIYIAQAYNPGDREVVRYTISGGVASQMTVIANNFNYPQGLAVDNAGNILVADNNSIYKIAASTTTFPISAANLPIVKSGLTGNDGIAVDNGGNIYVLGFMSPLLQRIDAVTNNLTNLPGDLNNPSAVAADAAGNIYVANTNGRTIEKYVQNGGYTISGLPAGLTFGATTGEVSGTPTTLTSATDYTITGYNTNGSSATAVVNMQVLSSNTNLSALTINAGSVTPAFSAGTISYTATVLNDVTTLHLNATSADAASTVSINGETATTGTASADVALIVGTNAIPIIVTAAAGNTKTYTLTITRQGLLGIEYTGPNTYIAGSAITPLVPSSSQVQPFAYGSKAAFYSAGTGTANIPNGIAVDKYGNIVLAVNGSVKRIAPNGTVLATITIPSYSAQYVALDTAGNIYTLNSGSGATFRKISITDNSVSIVGNGNTASSPTGLAVDASGYYMYYCVAASVRRIEVAAGYNGIISNGYTSATGLAINKAGDILVSDATGIYRIPAGTSSNLPKANLGGVYIPGFTSNFGFTIGNAGETFIADYAAKQLKRVDAAGTVTTIATGFIGPKWVASDNSGNIYISDNNGTASSTTVYRVTQNGGYYISPVLPPGLGLSTSTGTISGIPTTATPSFLYTVTAFGASGATTTNTVSISVVDPTLSSISTDQGNVSPAFSAATAGYTLSTGPATIKIAATVNNPGSTLSINGVAATSGVASTVTLTVGTNNIPIVVTASDGITTKTYTLTITRVSPPTVAYTGGPYTFLAGSAISPVTPTSTNVAALSYAAYNHFYNTISSTAQNVTTDAQGNVYTVSGFIYKIPAGGGTATLVSETGDFYSSAIIADAAGNIYAGGFGEAPTPVKKIAPDGTITEIATGFSYIYSIALDGAGNIYVSDGGVLKKIDATTHMVTTVTDAIGNLGAIGADRAGNIYAYGGATTTTYVYKIPFTATYPVALAQMTPMGTGLNGVTGVTIDNLGNIFTINQGGTKAILKTTPANVTTTIGSVPAPGNGIAVDPFGNVYTASQGYPLGVLQNKQLGGYYISPALPDGLTMDQNTGVISGTPTAGYPATDYTISAYNLGDNYTATTVNIKTIDPSLSALSISAGTLSPAFSFSTDTYTASVLPTVQSVTVTPKASAAGATITVNTVGVTSGTASLPITLQDGDNVINVTVTAPDGTTTKTYTVTVNRPIAPIINYGLAATQTYNVGTAITTLVPTSNDIASYGTNGYPASTAALSTITSAIADPWGIAVDPTGNLYVANATIARKITGSTITALPGTYTTPYSTATDAAGNYYVADYARGLVKNGVLFGSSSNAGIICVAIDAVGNIYMGNLNSNSVTKIAAGSTITTTFATGCSNPYGIATDAAGNVYVTKASASGTLTRISPTGVKTVLASGLNNPAGVELDATGNIYIASANKLQFIPSSVTSFPTTPINMIGNATFAFLGDLAIDAANNLYVTIDGTSNDIIQKLSPNGGYYISPALPAGLSFNNSTGAISGTPTIGSAAKTYTITGYNAASVPGSTTISLRTATSDATLSALILSAGTLSPVFSSTISEYSTTVTNSSITITPVADPSATITVNGIATTSGTASADVALAFGDNTIPVVVTSGDGAVTKTYTLAIKRVAGLNSLIASAGIFSPSFSSTKLNYVVPVSSATTTITFTPIADATITVNGSAVTSGSPSQSISLSDGANLVSIIVTNGDSTKTYTINVTKLLPQTINFPAYSGSQPTGLADSSPASSSSGLPIVYTTSTSTRVSIVNGKVHLYATGSGSVTASQPGNSVYEAATAITRTFTISKGTAVITLAELDTVAYGDADYTPAVSTNTGTNITYSSNNSAVIATASSNTRLKVVGLGLATITASQAGTSNYTLPANKTQTILVVKGQATAPIVFPALTAVRYNEPDFSPGATSAIPVAITYTSSDTTVAKIVNGKIHAVFPGTATITASQAAEDANHLPAADVSQVLTVNHIPVLLSNLTASTGQLTKVNDIAYNILVSGLTIDKLNLTPTATNPLATILVNGATVQSGVASTDIQLNAVGTPTVITLIIQDPDGVNSQDIKLTINRQASFNANLTNLVIVNGILNSAFADSTTSYTANLPGLTASQVKQMVFTADPTATVTVNGTAIVSGKNETFALNPTGTTTLTTIVTAEDRTTTKTYTVTINKVPATNATLKKLTLGNLALTKLSETEYTATVPGLAISQIGQLVTTEDPTATVTVNGTPVVSGNTASFALNPTGTTTLTTVVTAEDRTTTKTYTVTISKVAATNATLKKLTLGNLALTKLSETEYIATVPGLATSQIGQLVSTEDPSATVTVNGIAVVSGNTASFPLNPTGTTILTTVVTAEDRTTTKTYTVTISKVLSTDATLAKITLGKLVLNKLSETDYTATVPGLTTSQIGQLVTTEDPSATVTVNGIPVVSGSTVTFALNPTGTTTLTTVVTAEDRTTTKTYTVTISKVLSTNAILSKLTLGKLVLTKLSETDYTATIQGLGTSQIGQLVTTEDPTATVTVNGTPVVSGNTASFPLNATGTTTLTTVVTAEDRTTTKTYTVTISKVAATNATLKKLTLGNLALAKLSETEYTATVPGLATSQIGQLVTTEDPSATVTVNGIPVVSGSTVTFALNPTGTTTLTTVVTAEDRTTTKTYTVTISKVLSTNAILNKLTLGKLVLTKLSETDYTATIQGLGTSQIGQLVTTEDPTATVTVNGTPVVSGNTASFPLNATGTTTLTTVVTAEDRTTTKTYTVTISKVAATNATLKKLTLGNLALAKLSETEYTATVPGLATSQIGQLVTTEDPYATVTVNGIAVVSGNTASFPLNPTGTTTLTTVVTAEDRTTTKTYTVTINKVLSTNAILKKITLGKLVLTKLNETDYTATVPELNASQIGQLVTTEDPSATITVNGRAVVSGSTTNFALNPTGTTTLITVVTAEDRTTTKTYTITISKIEPAMRLATTGLTNQLTAKIPEKRLTESLTALTVHQALSPNGDGLNDVLVINGLNNYPDNRLLILNTAGTLIYETTGYGVKGNVFDGHDKNGMMQKPGTYYYILQYTDGNATKRQTGFIIIKY
jgi:gliding motility-associated-like protein